jgi:predicted transcriptional regulator
MPEIEIKNIDRRFESLRLKDKNRENALLQSILTNGILEPVSVIYKSPDIIILLDGFKRLRCLEKLKAGYVQVNSLGNTEQQGIIHLIRLSTSYILNTLEQAALIDELYKNTGMSIAEIANSLDRSKAWVSVRLGMLGEMSEVIKDAVFKGEFPVRNYLYNLRPFTRVNGIEKKEVDDFVKAVKGKKLSTRDIDSLSYAFFRGGDSLKKQIQNGNLDWTLKVMKNQTNMTEELENKLEIKVIKDLELVQKYMNHIIRDLPSSQLNSVEFQNNARIIIEGIFKKLDHFKKVIKLFYDQRTFSQDNH